MSFDKTLQEIIDRLQNKEQGYYNCIPFSLDRLSSVVPGLIQGEYYLVTGSSGSAKSKITRHMFIHEPYLYVKAHPELDIRFHVLYWSLEENYNKIEKTEMSRLLKRKYGINKGYRDLMSIGPNSSLTWEDVEKLKLLKDEMSEWDKHIKVFDASNANPTGIMKTIESFAYHIGRYYKSDDTPFTDAEMAEVRQGKGNWIDKVKYYRTDHPRHYVVILIDHVSLISTEQGMSLRDSIELLSKVYLLRARDRFGFIPVIVQQQQSIKEKMQYTSSGSAIEDKVEPSLDALADCTTTQREATIAFGIFNPYRYKIEQHSGYDITIMKDNYRSLKLLKQRDERASVAWPLYFEGESDFFKTLPVAKDENRELIKKIYEKIVEKNARKKAQLQVG